MMTNDALMKAGSHRTLPFLCAAKVVGPFGPNGQLSVHKPERIQSPTGPVRATFFDLSDDDDALMKAGSHRTPPFLCAAKVVGPFGPNGQLSVHKPERIQSPTDRWRPQPVRATFFDVAVAFKAGVRLT